MTQEGKYIYCIIGTNEDRNFGPIGIGGMGDIVSTICYQGLAMVISNTPMTKYVLSRENLTAHTKVIEEVMKDYTVLPVRFCTIAANTEEIYSLLGKRHTECKNLLRDMNNKIEMGLKAIWKDMSKIFTEIVEENRGIKRLKSQVMKKTPEKSYADKIEVGKLVQSALIAKKAEEGEAIIAPLKRIAVDFRLNETATDSMLLNAAFLIDRGREKEFDNLMEDLDTKYGDRIRFKYVGPVPPYNFVNITIHEP
ncbi:MAG: gas vesicle synthesis GvpLGvpF [bacterium (Candidatus Stahlbacteria) CG23_combo_of_CG06-09_8_20_14_all_40_9]|nr:MAG: gas vesicle synthesis GvpLGvpF [bacterium (Candidatus Stahlbacteria) CG23_combo_of_CG06-09_8_20_14_all_40_9]